MATSGEKLFLVKKDTVSIYQTTTGYFFKDEYVITSDASGDLEYSVSDGEKIPSLHTIATYREGEGDFCEIVIHQSFSFMYMDYLLQVRPCHTKCLRT